MTNRGARRAPFLIVAALALAACGDDVDTVPADSGGSLPPVTDGGTAPPTEPGGPEPTSIEGSWRLVAGRVDGEPVALVDGWDVTLDVEGDRVFGTAACNGYGGTVDLGDDGAFSVGDLNWTEMACVPEVMDVEQAVLRALPAVTTSELSDGALTLTGPEASLTFEPVPPAPTADIVDTTWVLDSIIQGEATSTRPGIEAATLRLHADGTLEGSTGCRRLEGTWVEAGAEIVFTNFSAIDIPEAGVCAPDAEQLDGLVITVLGDGFTAEVDRDRLTVMAPGNEGLVYVAG